VAVQEESVTPWQKLCSAIRRIVRRFETERGDSHAEWTLTVRVGPDTLDGGWVAECPELPGCFSQGESREEALSNLSERQRQLDVAQLHGLVLEQLLGITPEAIREQTNLRYLRDAGEAVEQVARGEADVTFLMNPVTMDQLREVAFAGEVMPQKSTDFFPKLLSGLAIYPLD